MSALDLGMLGNFLVGGAGLIGSTTLWSLGVASAAIPLVLKRPLREGAPGLATAAVLGAIRPGGLSGLILVAIFLGVAGMLIVPVLWLVGLQDPLNRRRAAQVLGATALTLAGIPLLPQWLMPLKVLALLWLLAAVVVAIPVCLVSLGQNQLRSRPWLPGLVSAVSFAAAWVTWRAFVHYDRLWEQAWIK